MANDDVKPGFWGWAQKHWFLTFLLAGSAISLPASIISAARAPAAPAGGTPPAVPPANPNVGPAAPFKPGDVVVFDPKAIPGAISVGVTLPDTSAQFNVRIDSLTAPPVASGLNSTLDPNTFMGTVVSPVTGVSVPFPRSGVVGVVSRS